MARPPGEAGVPGGLQGPPTPGEGEALLGWRFVTGFREEPYCVYFKTPQSIMKSLQNF